MSELIELFGTSFTVPNLEKSSTFYQQIYPHDEVKRGNFAGINYIALLRSGEVILCLFEQGEGNPLAESFPTFRVASVDTYAAEHQGTGGATLLPVNICPCTAAPFAILQDTDGNQFMIKEARAQ